jgi:hypothetical protein
MKELLQLFTQIALLRRGPQDVPASMLLLALTVTGYFGINLLVNSVLPPPPTSDWLAHLLLDVPFTLAWFALLLKIVGRPERILQTTTAVFGFQAVVAPLAVLSEYLTLRAAHHTIWEFPVKLLYIVLVVWLIAAVSHIVKAALEWSSPASVALVILQILTEQALVYALFPANGSLH